MRETRSGGREPVAAGPTDGGIALPATLLVDTGTSGGAELFASALAGNKRAELIGERTIGRTALQQLVKLPDGSGLWLTTTKFLTPDGSPLHEKGLEPAVAVDQPDVEFGQPNPTSDPVLEKALERLSQKKAA
jgi:carboxyl-terminal processing protease